MAGGGFFRELRLGRPLCPRWLKPRLGTCLRPQVLRTVSTLSGLSPAGQVLHCAV